MEFRLNENEAREWPNADKPGAYQLATRISGTVINPGDRIKFEQYITGYGDISGAKIQCYISPDSFDYQFSTVKHSLNKNILDDDRFEMYWGHDTENVSEEGFGSALNGLKNQKWSSQTMFFDISPHMNAVATERHLGTKGEVGKTGPAPFQFNLKTKNKIMPGEYNIDFYFTYFNSWEWIVHKERVSFRVNNKFEKYSSPLSLGAAAAIIVTLIHDGVYPFYCWTSEILSTLLK